MKYSELKLINEEVVRVTIELNQTCNGYQEFSVSTDWFNREVRRYEEKITLDKKWYWLFSCGGVNSDLIKEHFPNMIPFINLANKDIFGMDFYPIQNTLYLLNSDKEGDFEYGCKLINITSDIGYNVRQFSEYHFGEFLKKHINDVTKPLADKGIKLLETLTGKKFIPNCVISGQLFNDLHYCLITKDKGWNVYNKMENKKDLDYSKINLDSLIK